MKSNTPENLMKMVKGGWHDGQRLLNKEHTVMVVAKDNATFKELFPASRLKLHNVTKRPEIKEPKGFLNKHVCGFTGVAPKQLLHVAKGIMGNDGVVLRIAYEDAYFNSLLEFTSDDNRMRILLAPIVGDPDQALLQQMKKENEEQILEWANKIRSARRKENRNKAHCQKPSNQKKGIAKSSRSIYTPKRKEKPVRIR